MSADSLGIDAKRLEALFQMAAAAVESDGLNAAQLAVARHGVLVAQRTFGAAPDDALFAAFSTTKAVIASAVWLLFEGGLATPDDRVCDLVPELMAGAPERHALRLEHLLTHTAGFADAPFDALEWEDRSSRLARFASWRLMSTPGAEFRYHGTSSMWVIAEIIERLSGQDFRAFVRARVLEPLGLSEFYLGLPAGLDSRVQRIRHVNEGLSAAQMARTGLKLGRIHDDEAYFERYNTRGYRAVGVPGAGGITNAASLALFYQALLAPTLWRPETVADALTVRTGDLVDPMTGKPAHRGLGLVVSGDNQRLYRSFGATNSPQAFGHAGAGGQVSWADPATGISFAFLTDSFDRNTLRMGIRGGRLSTAAAMLPTGDSP